jgi:phage terminase large subunit-like protein
MIISTQAPSDNDWLSIAIDDSIKSKEETTVCHLYSAPADCEIMDEEAWLAANPAMGVFRSIDDVREQAERASRMASFEPTFRVLTLNQRVEMVSPFISRSIWLQNGDEIDESVFENNPVYAGLDLSAKTDLTALMLTAWDGEKWHIKSYFWTPEDTLVERAKRDRAPYDVWAKQGYIRTVPGKSIDYEYVARDIADELSGYYIEAFAFDRWRFDLLKKELTEIGVELPLIPFGQGFKDMSPALESLETALLNNQICHGNHPVLTMCMANSRVESDAAGNRKLNKAKATGRIDGAVALAMAFGVTVQTNDEGQLDDFLAAPLMFV